MPHGFGALAGGGLAWCEGDEVVALAGSGTSSRSRR